MDLPGPWPGMLHALRRPGTYAPAATPAGDQVPDNEANLLVTKARWVCCRRNCSSPEPPTIGPCSCAKRTSNSSDARCHGHSADQQWRLMKQGPRPHRRLHRFRRAADLGSGAARLCWPPSWPTGRVERRPGISPPPKASPLAGSVEAFRALERGRGPRPRDQPHRLSTPRELLATAPMMAALTFWPTLVVACVDSGQLDRGAEVDAPEVRGSGPALTFEACLKPFGPGCATGRPSGRLLEAALARFGPDDLDRALTHHAYGRLRGLRGERRQVATSCCAHQLLSLVAAAPFLARVEDLARRHPPRPVRSLHAGVDRSGARRGRPGGQGADQRRGGRTALHQPIGRRENPSLRAGYFANPYGN